MVPRRRFDRKAESDGGGPPARDKFRSLVENISEIVALIDADAVVRFVNPYVERVLGHPAENVVGHNIFEFIHTEDVPRAAQEYSGTVQQRGEAVPSVVRLRDSAGSWIPFEIIANNLLHHPDVQGVIFTARDLRFRKDIENHIHEAAADIREDVKKHATELAKINAALRMENQARRRTEHRLQETVSLLNATLDSTADGILVVSNSGRVSSCNRKFVEMWRLPCESSVGQKDEELLATVMDQLQNPDEFLSNVKALYSDPAATSFDVLHFKDGRIFERYSQPERIEGRIVGRVWSFRDVTRAKHLEEELRHSQKMEALGRLAGGIAHDFNNLLMLISGYVGQMLDDPELENHHRVGCEQVAAATKRAAAVTRQLLSFSRKHPDAPAVADLSEIVLDIEPMVRRLLSDCVELQISLCPDPLPVLVDVAQIEVLIMNLIINAQDAMPEGGMLSITTEREIAFPGTPEDQSMSASYSLLQVSDTGQGIAPELQGRIFEPFFTTKSLGKGTGLGLSTVYGIVERAGGFIELESKQNQGTRFRVYLPEATAVPGALPSPANATPRRGHETILLAEDEAGIRTMTRAYLEGLGYCVLEASDGLDAIRISREYQGVIDLVLTDVLMPHMRGDSAVNAMREQRPGLRALFISGYDQLADQPLHILFKPFEFSELARRIRAALDSDAAIPGPPSGSATN